MKNVVLIFLLVSLRTTFKNFWLSIIQFMAKFQNFVYFRNFYNWTMHFRHDADIVVSYGPDLVLKGQKAPYSFATTHKAPNQAGLNL